jgi:hypothetical protein
MGRAEAGPVTVALVADPGLPSALAEELADELPALLSRHVSDDRQWKIKTACQRLWTDQQGRIGLSKLSRPDAEITVFLTDLPRRVGRVPVVAETCAQAGVAVVSVPAAGATRMRQRIVRAVVRAVAELYLPDRSGGGRQRLGPFRRAVSHQDGSGVRYLGTGLHSRLRLLAGMVRANRPWRLVPSLSGAFAGALTTSGLVVVNQTVWKIAASASAAQLAGAAALAVTAMVAWLVIDHRMWEARSAHGAHDPVALYNAVTVITLTIGVLSMYAGLLALDLLAQWVLISSRLLSQTFGHPAGWADRATLAWLAASMATIGGAIGSGLDSKEAVPQAAYGYRQRERRRRQDQARGQHDTC